jgi:hypothetical protein
MNGSSAARAAVVAGLIVRGMLASSCSSDCGLALVERINFSSSPTPDSFVPVPCCGGFLYEDVNLSDKLIQRIDLANSQVSNGHVDAFLTSTECTKLFDASYNGSAAQPLCRIYVGPVAGGAVSQAASLPLGSYRVFAQAWASNDTVSVFAIDVGLYSTSCHLGNRNPIGF